MKNIFKSLLPWILFFAIFGNSRESKEIATIVALISHCYLNYRTMRKWFVLDIGTAVFFLLFAANIFIFKVSAITNHGYLISNCALTLIVWISLIIKKPFTLQYARQMVSAEIASSEIFLIVNYILTAVWAILFTLMIVPTILNFSINYNILITLLLLSFGFWITKKFPEWFADKMIEKRFNVDIKKLFSEKNSSAVDHTEFNVEKISTQYDFLTDVIIVGAGPVGLTSALLLQQFGVNALVLEKHPGISIHPKARAISCRSMELFRKLGVEEKVMQYSLPKSQNWFGWFSKLTGKLYARIVKKTNYSLISSTEEANVAQPFLEKVLLEQFQNQGGKMLFGQYYLH